MEGIGNMEAVKDDRFQLLKWEPLWICEKWSDEAVEFVRRKLESEGVEQIQDGCEIIHTGEMTWDNNLQMEVEKFIAVPRMIPIEHGITSAELRRIVGDPEIVEEVAGNLMLNEGIQELWDLAIAAGGTTAYNNANADIGVGDSTTSENATHTDLQAATNKLFKGMNATYPQRASQTVSWQSDFLTGEANYAWQEWSVRNGNTRNKNLNRKVQSLGTKASGTWTLTAQVTLS